MMRIIFRRSLILNKVPPYFLHIRCRLPNLFLVDGKTQNQGFCFSVLGIRIRIRILIRIRRIRMFLGLPDPHPNPLVTSTDPALDPYIIKQKYEEKA